MKVVFEFEKETKGAVRYTEVQQDKLAEPIIGTLYVRKSGLAKMGFKEIPSTLTIALPTVGKFGNIEEVAK